MKKCLTCKKELIGTKIDIPESIFKIGEKYEILYDDCCDEYLINHYFISFYCPPYKGKPYEGKWFSSVKDSSIYVYDYFYSDKELRKLKIKKLNEKIPDL
jgi:hypothetical protein